MIKIFKGICDKAQLQANDFIKKFGGETDIKDGNILINYPSLDKRYDFPIPVGINYFTDDESSCADIHRVDVFDDMVHIYKSEGRLTIVTKDKDNTTFIQDQGYDNARLIRILDMSNIDVDYEFEMVESEKYNVDNWKELFAKFIEIRGENYSKTQKLELK